MKSRSVLFVMTLMCILKGVGAATLTLKSATCIGTAKDDDFQGACVAPDGTLYVVGNTGQPLGHLPGGVTPRRFGADGPDPRCGSGLLVHLSRDGSAVLHAARLGTGIAIVTTVAANETAVYVGGYASRGLEELLRNCPGLMRSYPLRDVVRLHEASLAAGKRDPVGGRPGLGRYGAPCLLRFSKDCSRLEAGTYLEGWQQVWEKYRVAKRGRTMEGGYREYFWQPTSICLLASGDVVVSHDGGYFRLPAASDSEVAGYDAKLADRFLFYDVPDWVSRLSPDLGRRTWRHSLKTPSTDPAVAQKVKGGWPLAHYGNPRTHRMRLGAREGIYLCGWSASATSREPWWSPYLWKLDAADGKALWKAYDYDPLSGGGNRMGGQVSDTAVVTVAPADDGTVLAGLIADGGNTVMEWGPRGGEGVRMREPLRGKNFIVKLVHFWGQIHRLDDETREGKGGARIGPWAWVVDMATTPRSSVLAVGRYNADFEWTDDAWFRASPLSNPNAFLRLYSPAFELQFSTAVPGVVPFEITPIGGGRFVVVGRAASGVAPIKNALTPRPAGNEDGYIMIVEATGGLESTLRNPTKREYADALVRLTVPPPGPPGTFTVTLDGAEVPYQVEQLDGKKWIWVCASFQPLSSETFVVTRAQPQRFPQRVTVRRVGDSYLLENAHIAVKVPAEAPSGTLPGPISAVRIAPEKWIGGSSWTASLPLRRLTATVVGDGTVLGKVRLRYEFNGMAGLEGTTSAFSEITIALGPTWRHVEITERHAMARGDHWEFDASRGWTPHQGISKPFSRGAGSGLVGGTVKPARALKPGGLPYAREDLFLNLFPRWNQHYKDGWFFAASDGERAVGAVVVRASRWVWPHSNALQAVVKPSGDYAGIQCPTRMGQRLWWLTGPGTEAAEPAYLARYAWEHLDKLNHEFILTWPGRPGAFRGMNFYDGNRVNPSGPVRGMGRRAMAGAGKGGDLGTLLEFQVWMHPDAWGSYWNFWSPENPNFFTDFIRVPLALATRLRDHPRFDDIRAMAERKLREDLYHSVTLPGGAGQECPGYVSYALKHWSALAPLCRAHLGFDPTTWERFQAAKYFEKRLSQPDGSVRRALPMGDTHPGKDGKGPKEIDVPAGEVTRFATEELPGFGVVFTNRPGTSRETYLAFKSGPNRGHYHGDQLAFHYCANARALAVDHHCSYRPRAGQEHMHNRVAFHTDRFPYANMDGYERVIAFKTTPAVDVAVGQVESDRLRRVERLPPEIWHQEYPQHAFARPLTYRRTVVFMKSADVDYFVFRDQFWASEPLAATFCLHVRSEKIRHAGRVIDFGNCSLLCAEPEEFTFESFPWRHSNGGGESTQGARLTVRGSEGEIITVLYPGKLPAVAIVPGGVTVGEDTIRFAGNQPGEGAPGASVVVERGRRTLLKLTAGDIDLQRSQGAIGLFVPDAGYPFGEIPDWLIRQRAEPPAWAR